MRAASGAQSNRRLSLGLANRERGSVKLVAIASAFLQVSRESFKEEENELDRQSQKSRYCTSAELLFSSASRAPPKVNRSRQQRKPRPEHVHKHKVVTTNPEHPLHNIIISNLSTNGRPCSSA